jgi:hypothetical protein
MIGRCQEVSSVCTSVANRSQRENWLRGRATNLICSFGARQLESSCLANVVLQSARLITRLIRRPPERCTAPLVCIRRGCPPENRSLSLSGAEAGTPRGSIGRRTVPENRTAALATAGSPYHGIENEMLVGATPICRRVLERRPIHDRRGDWSPNSQSNLASPQQGFERATLGLDVAPGGHLHQLPADGE